MMNGSSIALAEPLEPRRLLHAGHDHVSPPPGGLKFNFQPESVTTVPAGYRADIGRAYGVRANGLSYGWDRSNEQEARVRGNPASPDERYDTLNHLAVDGRWSIDVVNGAYWVRVVAGDANYFNSVFRINVEGVMAIDAVPTADNRWIDGWANVTVVDGNIGITSAEGAVNNKLAFVEIYPQSISNAVSVPAAPSSLSASGLSTSSMSVTWDDRSDNEGGFYIERRLDGSGESYKRIATVERNVESYADTGLPGGTRYVYRVQAFNTAGRSAYSNSDGGTTFETQRTLSWQTVAPSPIKRAESLGGVVNGKLYVLGGLFDESGLIVATRRCDVYDPATNRWTRIADMPEKLTHSGIVIVGNVIWLIGSYIGDHPGPGYRGVYKYDTVANTWSTGPSLPSDRGAGSAALINNHIHFFGGLGASREEDKSDHWSLNLANQSAGWQRRASLLNARNHTSAVTVGKYIYVIGGQHDEEEFQQALSDVWRYDASNDSWLKMTSLPSPRSHTNASTFAMNGRIIVIGGEVGYGQPRRTVLSYNPSTNKWSDIGALPAARSTSVAGVLPDGRIISSTGNSPGPTTTTWIGTFS